MVFSSGCMTGSLSCLGVEADSDSVWPSHTLSRCIHCDHEVWYGFEVLR